MSTIEEYSCWKNTLASIKDAGVQGGDRVLLALSGGPDSTALLAVLRNITETIPFHLACAYVDHGIRGGLERMSESEHIAWCESYFNVPVYRYRIPEGEIANYAADKNCGIEAAARKFRYRFLCEIAKEHSYRYIALGHTSDDQIETIITRFFSGAGTEGLSGIPARQGRCFRPFLQVTKEEIRRFLKEFGIPFINDSTNFSTDYQRNAVRRTLLPVIEEVFPGFKKGLSSFRHKMEEVTDFIHEEAAKIIPLTDVSRKDRQKTAMNWEIYRSSPAVLRKQRLFDCINFFGKEPDRRVPYRFIEELDGKICEKENNGHITSAYGVRFSKYGDKVYAEADVVFPEKKGYLLVVGSGVIDCTYRYGFQIQKTLVSSTVENAPWLYDDNEMYPLIVRSLRSGDVIADKNGRKEVRKLFQEWNVPDTDKWEIPVVEDASGIRAVFGSFFGYPDKYRVTELNAETSKKEKILVFSYCKDGKG